MEIEWIPVSLLEIADYNPREARSPEVIQSIIETYKLKNLIKPLLVRKREDGKYDVFDGGTRLEALKILKIDRAPCIVYDCSRKEAIEIAAIVHTNREELTPAEKGKFILRCINEGIWRNVEEAAKALGFSKDTIYDWIREARIYSVSMDSKLKNILNRDVKKALASMPKPVREMVINELASLTEEITEKIKKELPNILSNIARKSFESEPDEVLREFRENISKIIEAGPDYSITFRASSGLMYQIDKVENNIVIKILSRNSSSYQLTIPSIDLREFIRKLSRFIK
jgi:ParB/RepB/Spo0J family partition protein